jgi:hypothetical protein
MGFSLTDVYTYRLCIYILVLTQGSLKFQQEIGALIKTVIEFGA